MRTIVILFVAVFSLIVAMPVFAQNAFYEAFQNHLPEVASASSVSSTPVLGDAEAIRTDISRGGSAEPYAVYNLGGDRLNGYLGAGAVLIGMLTIVLVFAMVLSHRHHDHSSK